MFKKFVKFASYLGILALILISGLVIELFIDKNPAFITWAASYVPSILMVEGGINVCTESGSSNTFTLTCGTSTKAIQAYVTGTVYYFVATHANTSASTGNINTIGSKNITKLGGNATALASGDIASGSSVALMYDGTQLEMISPTSNAASGSVTTTGSPASGQMAKFSGGASITTATVNDMYGSLIGIESGSTNTFTVTTTPASTADVCIVFKATHANTGAATMALDGRTGIALTLNGPTATALVANDIKNNQIVLACPDGTRWEMMSPSANVAGGTVSNVTTTAPLNVTNGTTTPALTYTGLNAANDYWIPGWGPNPPWQAVTTVDATGGNNSANTVEYRRIYFPGGTINKIVFEIVIGASTGSHHFMYGWYNTSGNVVLSTGLLGITAGVACSTPDVTAAQKVITSSVSNCSGTNGAQVGLGTNLPAGYYWEFSTADSTTLTFRAFTITATALTSTSMNGGSGILVWSKTGSASTGGIPNTFTGLSIPPGTADSQGMMMTMIAQ